MNQLERRKDGKLEVNLAIQEIRCAFELLDHQPYKISQRTMESEDYLEVSFITPEIAALYKDVLEELRIWSLWDIRFRTKPNSARLIRLATGMLPNGCILQRNPSVYAGRKTVTIKTETALPEDVCVLVSNNYQRETGYRLEIVIKLS